MNPLIVLGVVALYFALLMGISWLVSRNSSDQSFFTGDRSSPWPLVAYGMIGAALSGVTFVSIPGMVGNNFFYYFQFVLGNVVGYLFITYVLIPVYYRLQLVSIYSYLSDRFGNFSYRTGSMFFLISQSFGAALRLLLAAKILQFAFFDHFGIPFYLSVIIIIALIWLYINKSGIKAIVWTDSLQTTFLILAAIVAIFSVKDAMGMSLGETINSVVKHKYFELFNWDGKAGSNFFKQFISGILIAIAMMGLDQNMMQKTLTCKSRSDAQKNALVFSMILAVTQFLFLGLGVILYIYAEHRGISLPTENGQLINTDNLFPMLSLNEFGTFAGVTFILGITAAAFSSIDSALTALTTSFTHDFLDVGSKPPAEKTRIKNRVLVGFCGVVFIIIMLFSQSKGDIITTIFRVAGYTYGPLLGLYLLGIFTKIRIWDKAVPAICIFAPIATYLLSEFMSRNFQFDFGFMNIFVNAAITVICLIAIRKKS